ncbi:hypothetical protein FQR65_LT02205 [Abscondita terminalis]|nr:hypothetical protein FQR65_LT02205 [Abscondita terminalis]
MDNIRNRLKENLGTALAQALQKTKTFTNCKTNLKTLKYNSVNNGKTKQAKSNLNIATTQTQLSVSTTDVIKDINLSEAPLGHELVKKEKDGFLVDNTSNVKAFETENKIKKLEKTSVNKKSPMNVNLATDNSNEATEKTINLKSKCRKRKITNYASLLEDEEVDEPKQSTQKVNVDGTQKSKRGRKKGYKVAPKVCEDTTNEIDEQVKKKGLPRGKFAPRNLLHLKLVDTVVQQLADDTTKTTTAKSYVNPSPSGTTDGSSVTEEDNSKTEQDLKSVTCAICKSDVLKGAWSHHKYRYHNNLAWRIGDEPLDLNDSELVMGILNDIYKRRRPLYCENCNVVKKSVMGYLSHKSVCQRSHDEIQAYKVKCNHCSRFLLPISMSVHMKSCTGLKTNTIPKSPATNKNDEVPINSKRRAATRLLMKSYFNCDIKFCSRAGNRLIQDEINKNGCATCWFQVCNFESAELNEMIEHIFSCQYKPSQGFTCKYCFITYSNEREVIEHSKQNHSAANDDEFECDGSDQDENEEDFNALDFLDQSKLKVTVQPKKSETKLIFFVRYSHCSCRYNYTLNDLFSHWRTPFSDYNKVKLEEVSKYLPKQKFSVCTSSVREQSYKNLLHLKYNWKRYKLFESELLDKDTSTFFCGGTITAMAWVPTPYDEEESLQILAVSTNSNFNKGYPIHQLYEEPGIIQFWNCGTLKNDNVVTEQPLLQFCLVHDHGPIWCLEWCPSGSYDKALQQQSPQRLGVLAVGSADSFIYLYSISLPDFSSGKLIKLNPVLKLQLNSMTELSVNEIEPHVTKLSWTRAKRHSYIAAGYSNGMVALFDLNSTSPLLKVYSDKADDNTLLPYQILPAHHHAVTALYLYHLNGGRRWLMTASLDRTIKYWDLENPLVSISNFTKYIVTDGVWLNHWISTVHTYEDCCGGGLTLTSINQLRNFESSSSSILHSNSCVSSISGSDWTNSFIQGNAAGEITGFFPHQLFHYLENDKSFRVKKGVLGYARVVEKNLTVEEQTKKEKVNNKKSNDKNQDPMNYEEANNKYGLVFCDLVIDSIKELPNNLSSYYKSNTDKFYPSTPHIYPLQSINQIAINPNASSYCYYATAYQAGFVRISNFKRLNMNSFQGTQT